MDFTTQEWLTVLIVVLIIGIFLDGFRRMRNARRDSLKMSLKLKNKVINEEDDDFIDDDYGSEFPNGGARTSEKEIDKERIAKVRSKFDFGADMSRLTRGFNQAIDKITDRVEPTVDESLLEDHYNVNDEVISDYDDELDAPLEDIVEEQADIYEPEHERPMVESDVAESDIGESVMDDLAQERVYSEPQQVPLNLDDNVPMLMETADDTVSDAVSDIDEDSLNIQPVGKSVGTENELNLADDEVELKTHSANKPRYLSKSKKDHGVDEAAENSSAHQPTNPSSIPEEVLVLHVKASEDNVFQGSDLLQLVLENGLRYGAMDIFHRHANEEGEGPILFSMANMVMPGIFDLKTFDDFSTVGVSFFLTLPVDDNKNMVAFDAMLLTAKNIASELGGELKDEQRSVMTGQTIEHYRERIRDFSRRQQLEKNK